jgi:hypothetical protein
MQLPEIGAVSEIVTRRAKKATVEKIEALAAPTMPAPLDEDSEVIRAFEERHQCAECEKSFKTQQGLAGHMRVHKPHPLDDAPPPDPAYEHLDDPTTAPKPELVKDPADPEAGSPSGPTSASAEDSNSGAAETLSPGLPDDYLIHQDGARFEVSDPNGEVVEGRYYTYADACVAAQNHAFNDAPNEETPLKLADIYAWCRLHSVPAPAVGELINGDLSDQFEQFREDGAEQISAFNLDAGARAVLLEALTEKYARV